MIETLIIKPLSYPFVEHAMLVGLLVALTCALLSCFIVLKGWALMGDAISHAILPGVVIAASLGLPLSLGAFIAGLTCALATGWLESKSHLKSDTLLGIVFAGMFALGIIMFMRVDSDQHLMHILFGNILGLEKAQRIQVYVLSAIVLSIVFIKRRDFMLFVFDVAHARVAGLNVRLIYFSLLTLLSITAVSSLQAVGVVLVVAMLITPGITAQLVSRSFYTMLIVACSVSVLSTSFGILLSVHIDASTSACIVLTQSAVFILMLGWRYFKRQYDLLFWTKESQHD